MSPHRARLTAVLTATALAAALAACKGKDDPGKPATTSTPPAGEAQADSAPPANTVAPSEAVALPTTVGAGVVRTEAEEAERRDALAAMFARLESATVTGMTRTRFSRHGDSATLLFDRAAPNAAGFSGSVTVTVAACEGCAQASEAEFEALRERLRDEVGEPHTENPDLVVAVETFELAPGRDAVASYRKSVVHRVAGAPDDVRAVLHLLEVDHVDSELRVHLIAYPRDGFPESTEQLDAQYGRSDLEHDVVTAFRGLVPALWPPANLEGPGD